MTSMVDELPRPCKVRAWSEGFDSKTILWKLGSLMVAILDWLFPARDVIEQCHLGRKMQ